MSIDWTKPLGLMDGTPVVAEYNDEASCWRVQRADGLMFTEDQVGFSKRFLFGVFFKEDGRFLFGDDNDVRIRNGIDHVPNAETIEAMREIQARQIIRDLLAHAVYDEAKSDECIDAVAAARRFLGEVG